MQFSFQPSDLQPLIQQVVDSTLAQLNHDRSLFGDRLAFPALIEVIKLKNANTTPSPYTSIENYPKLGEELEARVFKFVDRNRQIGLTQLGNEPESELSQ